MDATLEQKRYQILENALMLFDFGSELNVLETGNWSHEDQGMFNTRPIYVESTDSKCEDSVDEEETASIKYTLTVIFEPKSTLVKEVYCITPNGNLCGEIDMEALLAI